MDRRKKNWLGDQSVRNYTSKEYIEDGHLQVKVGDKFNGGQYEVQVLCKLGWGQSSTVWLAHDLKNKMNVALKIVKSDSCYKDVAREEINILKLIAKKDPVGKRGVVKILDSFRHEEKKNTYSCIVLEYLGDGLGTLIDYSRDLKGIPLHAIKKICVHILSGLDFLHRELRLVHCQLKPDNILLMSRLDQSANPNVPPPIVPISATLSESGASKGLKRSGEELTKNQGSEKRAKITSQGCEGKKNAEENEVDLKLKRVATIDKQCRLINFGKACWENEISPNVIQSRNYRSPEVILGYSRSYPVDIWSFACICFELATGDLLFDPQSGHDFDKDMDHVALMIELLGSMPTKMALGGRYSWKFFNNKGEWFDKKLHLGDFWPLKFVLREKYDFTNKDADDLGGFLESILKFDPEVRPTAKDLLQHKFLNS